MGIQINIYRNDTTVMVFTWGSKNTWIMMKTNSLKERKQSIGFLSFLLWLNTSLTSKRINYKNQVRKNKNHYWWKNSSSLVTFPLRYFEIPLESLLLYRKAFQWFKSHLCAQSIRTGTTLFMQWFESNWRAQLSCKFQWRQRQIKWIQLRLFPS